MFDLGKLRNGQKHHHLYGKETGKPINSLKLLCSVISLVHTEYSPGDKTQRQIKLKT